MSDTRLDAGKCRVEPGRVRKHVAIGSKGLRPPAVERQQLIVGRIALVRPRVWNAGHDIRTGRRSSVDAGNQTPFLARQSNEPERPRFEWLRVESDHELVEIRPTQVGIDR